MTQEEKDLLVKDLSARLPYEVKVWHFGVTRELLEIIPSTENVMVGYDINDYEVSVIEDIKPYLRPMSSMTEEERYTFDIMTRGYTIHQQASLFDWLNAHHFDYRGLISMGLAIEVTSENNPYKE